LQKWIIDTNKISKMISRLNCFKDIQVVQPPVSYASKCHVFFRIMTSKNIVVRILLYQFEQTYGKGKLLKGTDLGRIQVCGNQPKGRPVPAIIPYDLCQF
jgi:hypothetical protein